MQIIFILLFWWRGALPTAHIIDEAHRGVPDDGVYIKNVLKRFGKTQTQIFFTATSFSFLCVAVLNTQVCLPLQ
jgi:hypothetical protein